MNVVILEVHQLYNAEINDAGQFCCCDDATNCTDSLSDLKTCVNGTCDTYLKVNFRPCHIKGHTGACALTTDVTFDSESIDDLDLCLDFIAVVQPQSVRIQFIVMYIYIYMHMYIHTHY